MLTAAAQTLAACLCSTNSRSYLYQRLCVQMDCGNTSTSEGRLCQQYCAHDTPYTDVSPATASPPADSGIEPCDVGAEPPARGETRSLAGCHTGARASCRPQPRIRGSMMTAMIAAVPQLRLTLICHGSARRLLNREHGPVLPPPHG